MEATETILAVTGMTCGFCVRQITHAFGEVPGVAKVEVDLGRGLVRVRHGEKVGVPALVAKLEDLGYGAVPASR